MNVSLLPLLSKLLEAYPKTHLAQIYTYSINMSRTPRRSDAEFQSLSDRMAWELESRQLSPECNPAFEMILDSI